MNSSTTKKDTWIGFSGQTEDLYLPAGTDFRKLRIFQEEEGKNVKPDQHEELNKSSSFTKVS